MNILFLTTRHGRNKFAKQLCKAAYRQGNKGYTYFCTSIAKAFTNHPEWNPNNLVIHARAANPKAPWMKELEELEAKGYTVVNSTKVLKLTSDKWASIQELEEIGNIPMTYLYDKRTGRCTSTLDVELSLENALYEMGDEVVIKPRISQGQGQHVHRVKTKDVTPEKLALVPGRHVLIQNFVEYQAIYRVFCFNGFSAEMVTVDYPTEDRWKVSVCLNKLQKPDYADDNIDVVEFAETIQRVIGGQVNFIDVFVDYNGDLILSEVNTACTLGLHSKMTGLDFAELIAQAVVKDIP